MKNWQQFCGVEVLEGFHQKTWLVQQKGNTSLEEVPASWRFGKTSESVYKAFRILMTTWGWCEQKVSEDGFLKDNTWWPLLVLMFAKTLFEMFWVKKPLSERDSRCLGKSKMQPVFMLGLNTNIIFSIPYERRSTRNS